MDTQLIKKNENNIKGMDLSSMTVIELKKIAKEKGLSGLSKFKKADLLNAINKNTENKKIENKLSNKKTSIKRKISKKTENRIQLTSRELIDLLKKKITEPKWSIHKHNIEDIIKEIEKIFFENLQNEKDIFISNGGNEIDFYYKSAEKEEFDKITYDYRKMKRDYFKEIENQKKINSELKKDIIEQIKELIGTEGSINIIYKKFKSLQETWHKTGPALRSDNNNLWETYKHHVERFYDFLHINRELRNIDYKHNYDEKIKIIQEAEELVKIEDILKAGRDLNVLHRLWKKELGPVAPENREPLWKRFQEASKLIHAKRQDFQKNIEKNQIINLERKNLILKNIEKLTNPKPNNHKGWQLSIRKFNELREEFKKVGVIPKSESKKNWGLFREKGRIYNLNKNQFYKNQKNNQKKIIEKYKNLIHEVKEINEKEDWKKFVERMKSIQIEFNNNSYIPISILKKLRTEFQTETNLYFQRLKSGYQKINADEEILYKKKLEIVNSLKKLDFSKKEFTKIFTEQWENIQNIGNLNRQLEIKIFNLFIKSTSKILKGIHDLKVDKSNILFDIELYCLESNLEELQVKINYYKKTIDELQNEINQLENNLEFFSQSSTESPLLKEVTEKLNTLTTKSFLWKERFNKLKSAKNKTPNSVKKDLKDVSKTE
ncbi:MAG: DUF349 domain-containing protein [Flavobacteriaceae bacterium]|nr:DUF349 domain-containing protein [Flavobacteriaceae bacterium]